MNTVGLGNFITYDIPTRFGSDYQISSPTDIYLEVKGLGLITSSVQ